MPTSELLTLGSSAVSCDVVRERGAGRHRSCNSELAAFYLGFDGVDRRPGSTIHRATGIRLN